LKSGQLPLDFSATTHSSPEIVPKTQWSLVSAGEAMQLVNLR